MLDCMKQTAIYSTYIDIYIYNTSMPANRHLFHPKIPRFFRGLAMTRAILPVGITSLGSVMSSLLKTFRTWRFRWRCLDHFEPVNRAFVGDEGWSACPFLEGLKKLQIYARWPLVRNSAACWRLLLNSGLPPTRARVWTFGNQFQSKYQLSIFHSFSAAMVDEDNLLHAHCICNCLRILLSVQISRKWPVSKQWVTPSNWKLGPSLYR